MTYEKTGRRAKVRVQRRREADASAMLMWNDALSSIDAANQLGAEEMRFGTVRLHLVTRGIELAMKSLLRARGWTLDRIQTELGHSLNDILAALANLGTKPPTGAVRSWLELLSEARERRELRYAHTDHPTHMDRSDWIVAAEWALRAAIPAVAEAEAGKDAKGLVRTMQARTTRVVHPGAASGPL